jgi:hypothetical protein
MRLCNISTQNVICMQMIMEVIIELGIIVACKLI